MSATFAARWWRELDRPGWRSFAIAMVALGVALLLALYSGAAAESGRLYLVIAPSSYGGSKGEYEVKVRLGK